MYILMESDLLQLLLLIDSNNKKILEYFVIKIPFF